MEQYAGVAILATNLRANLDQAFTRRMTFAVHFPFPDEDFRRRIWERIWPPNAPLADDLDLAYLSRAFPLTGGNIRNIALAAAFLAAAEDGQLSMAHVFVALRREYQKMGKQLTEAELWAGLHVSASGPGVPSA
jgi:SpoVK/Ycf46/Vps4 family AAA+-type ATPase